MQVTISLVSSKHKKIISKINRDNLFCANRYTVLIKFAINLIVEPVLTNKLESF